MTPSELDRLADYAEGLLEGTPDGDAVAARIATDQEWADAYRQLTAVVPGITAELGGFPDEPIPADVAAALDRALAAESTRPREDSDEGLPGPWVAPEPPDELDRLRTQHAANRRRTERRRRTGGWVAAAAAVAVIGACGVGILRGIDQGGDDSGESSTVAADSSKQESPPSVLSAPSAAPAPQPARSVRVSGSSYSTGELGRQALAVLGGADQAASAGPSAPTAPATVPPALERLAGPADLRNCLTALRIMLEPLVVDYATLDGTPAIVIVVEDSDPNRLVVVAAGAACGIDGNADERARTTVAR